MDTPRIMGVLLMVVVFMGQRGSFSPQDDAEFQLLIRKIQVKPTDANGNAWDANDSKPDLVVTVRNLSEKSLSPLRTKARTATSVAIINDATGLKFRQGDQLVFRVVDQDLMFDDEIGAVRWQATNIREGEQRFIEFGRVLSLEFEVRKQ